MQEMHLPLSPSFYILLIWKQVLPCALPPSTKAITRGGVSQPRSIEQKGDERHLFLQNMNTLENQ